MASKKNWVYCCSDFRSNLDTVDTKPSELNKIFLPPHNTSVIKYCFLTTSTVNTSFYFL